MLEQIKYKNHLNEVFEFGKNGVYANENDLHDYQWTANKKGNRIASFIREVQTKKLPLTIKCNSVSEGIQAKNKLLEIAEKDILAMQPGTIIIGSWYFKCYIAESSKKDYLISKDYIQITLKLKSDQPYWIKESTVSFGTADETDDENAHGYPFDFPFNYASGTANTELINSSFVPSNFRMVIYGSVVNPSISINGHVYKVNCTVPEGSYLTIDSVTKKIYLTANDGTITNVFAQRYKDSYIFEKIPEGQNVVNWTGSFKFDITILEERSEPMWI